ncbi:AraC family transcriptional regulator [Ferrimonas balearica]|nr:AraC family transcriptional regulator [Ferrimonas balearica]MBY6105625.1 AraC family transcriptional regulator [Ferrimonas balearica]
MAHTGKLLPKALTVNFFVQLAEGLPYAGSNTPIVELSGLMNALAQALAPLAHSEGVNTTPLPGVWIFKASESRPREPLCYSQGIIIMAQGTKRVHLDEQVFEYNPDNYLVLTLPIPAECETVVEDEPMLSLVVDINIGVLHQLVRLFEEHRQAPGEGRMVEGRSLYVSPLGESMQDSAVRLAQALASPLQAEALGPGLIQSLLYHALQGEQSGPLFALARHNTHLARLERALRHMHEHYQQSLDIDQLAAMANMSPSTFHRNFRQMTASSPIQYLKKLRLTRARELLQDRGLKVKQAAAMVGYESPTQFSREFKRYFGETPQHWAGQGA